MTSTTTAAVFNGDELLRRCMGNTHIAQRILLKFQDRFVTDMEELERGLRESNAEVITSIAHRVKGSAANVSATTICEIATEMERLGRAGDLTSLPSHFEWLQTEWARFAEVVGDFELPENG